MTRMTREEAIEVIKQDIPCEHDTDLIEALDMAIKSLEQEPCDNAISREDTMTALRADSSFICPNDKLNAIRIVEGMPPVTPKPKIGHWKRISIDKYVQHATAYYKCSVCGKDTIGTHNYCPNCGVKMQDE